jgi:hypothetical protein
LEAAEMLPSLTIVIKYSICFRFTAKSSYTKNVYMIY